MLEHQQIRNCYEEARRLLSTAKTQHIMQLEEIRFALLQLMYHELRNTTDKKN